MKDRSLRTTVIGSYPFPGWLEFACQNLEKFGPDDRAEAQDDAVIAAASARPPTTSGGSTRSRASSARRAAWASSRNTSA